VALGVEASSTLNWQLRDSEIPFPRNRSTRASAAREQRSPARAFWSRLVLLLTLFAPRRAHAEGDAKPINLSLFTPVQIFPKTAFSGAW